MEEKTISSILQDDKSESWFQEKIIANAPIIIAVFANFVVIFADYRVYDVIYQLTGVWWKALAASLACAVPFILWEIGWQYNHTTDFWRRVSLFMAGLAFATSIVLGVADYVGMTSVEWQNILLGGVVVLTGAHTVAGFLYYYNDPDVARRRRKAQALGTMLDAQLNAQVTEQLLEEGDNLLTLINKLGKRYPPEEVEKVMSILQGKGKQSRPDRARKQFTQRPIRDYAKDMPNPTERDQN